MARSSNAQRSNVKNPNNPAFKADMANRSNAMNPNNPAYQASIDNRSRQLNVPEQTTPTKDK